MQLREATTGETSAAVLEALAAGVPVVTNLATAAEYPDGTVALARSAEPTEVATHISDLLGAAKRRRALSGAGKAFAADPFLRGAGRAGPLGRDVVKLGLVVPRYGQEVVGGTEHWLRMLCEHLVAMKGWPVEVFTTCARSAATWADELAPGTTVVNGVSVHRHRSRSGRDARYLALYDVHPRRPARPCPTPWRHQFIDLVGPVCPEAIDAAARSDCALMAVTPYLYWPAVHGVARLGRKVIFHGAAHDEPELHLPVMRGVYTAVGGFAFNSHAERTLVEGLFRVGQLPSSVIGNAVVESPGDADAARAALGLGPDERFVLCLGRVERAKGSHVLAELWRLYRARRPAAPRLVFMGPVHQALAPDDAVAVAGEQPEAVKWGALRACDAVISPSVWESFSLVILEAWLAGAPVVVNRRCAATVEHCENSQGGLWFTDYDDFEVVMDRLLADHTLRARLAANGRAYTERHFSWPAVVDRYEDLARRIAARLPAVPTAGPHGHRDATATDSG